MSTCLGVDSDTSGEHAHDYQSEAPLHVDVVNVKKGAISLLK
jgi:hypothetical protein